jgi:hypothetical protein
VLRIDEAPLAMMFETLADQYPAPVGGKEPEPHGIFAAAPAAQRERGVERDA